MSLVLSNKALGHSDWIEGNASWLSVVRECDCNTVIAWQHDKARCPLDGRLMRGRYETRHIKMSRSE